MYVGMNLWYLVCQQSAKVTRIREENFFHITPGEEFRLPCMFVSVAKYLQRGRQSRWGLALSDSEAV